MRSSLFLVKPFHKTLIFHLGSEAGFYSEFNNMVLGILYCYKHDINFKIYSKDANFAYDKGWTDFFQPFCREVKDSFHSVYNFRQPNDIFDGYRYNIKKKIYKILYHFNFYTYELWDNFHNKDFEKERFLIEGIDMDILDASRYVIKRIWKYNEETQVAIDKLINSVQLPEKYIGLHIRRGDKFLEQEEVNIEKYFEKIREKSTIRDVFVYTDNYDVISKIRKIFTQYTIYTLVDEYEHGYFHNEFIKKDTEFRKNALLKMFASVDILSRAELSIGTFSTNPGMFLGMCMPKGKMIGVDYDKWMIW